MLEVESGWHGFSEVNRVVFDPQHVTVEEMTGWLKETGTFVRTLEQTIQPPQPVEEMDNKLQ